MRIRYILQYLFVSLTSHVLLSCSKSEHSDPNAPNPPTGGGGTNMPATITKLLLTSGVTTTLAPNTDTAMITKFRMTGGGETDLREGGTLYSELVNAEQGQMTTSNTGGSFTTAYANKFTSQSTIPNNPQTGKPDTAGKVHWRITDAKGNQYLLFLNTDAVGNSGQSSVARSTPGLTASDVTYEKIRKFHKRTGVKDINTPSFLQ